MSKKKKKTTKKPVCGMLAYNYKKKKKSHIREIY